MHRIDALPLTADDLDAIVQALRAGGVVCLPTDTLYGLAVDAADAAAVARLLRLKGRPDGKPIPLLVASLEMARSAAFVDDRFERLARAFWPGPLTIIAPAAPHLPDGLTAGSGTIGLRWPDARVAQEIVRAFGGPITGTSANRSGEPPAPSADEAGRRLARDLDVLVDGGPAAGRASTVVDLTSDPWTLVREGPISRDAIAEALGGAGQRSA